MPSRIIQLTDLHIDQKPKSGNNKKVREVLRKAVDVAAGDLIVITGDLLDNGYFEEYWKCLDDIFATELTAKKARVVVTPGNHDASSILPGQRYDRQSWLRFCKRFPWNKSSMEVPMALQLTDTTDVIFLNSLAKGDTYFACGTIGETQLGTLRDHLDSLKPPQKSLIFMHHHLYNENPFEELVDARRLERVIKDHLDVVGFVGFGHRHDYHEYAITNGKRKVQVVGLEKSTNSGTFIEIFQTDTGDWNFRRPK